MRVLIGIFAAWACAWAIVLLNSPSLAIVAGLGFLQNLAFTFMSRGRNSGSLWYHMVAAVFSNGIFIAMFVAGWKIMQSTPDSPWAFAAVYTLSTMAGSVFAHWLAKRVEKGAARNVQEDRVEKIEKDLERLNFSMNAHRTDLARLWEKINSLDFPDEQFAEIETRIQENEERINGLLNDLDEHEGRLREAEQWNNLWTGTAKHVDEIHQALDAHAREHDEIEDGSPAMRRLNRHEKEFETLRSRLDKYATLECAADLVDTTAKQQERLDEMRRNLEAVAREVWGFHADQGLSKDVQELFRKSGVGAEVDEKILQQLEKIEEKLGDLDRLRHALRTRATIQDAMRSSTPEVGVPHSDKIEEAIGELREVFLKPSSTGREIMVAVKALFDLRPDQLSTTLDDGENVRQLEEYLEDFSGSLHDLISDAWNASQKALRTEHPVVVDNFDNVDKGHGLSASAVEALGKDLDLTRLQAQVEELREDFDRHDNGHHTEDHSEDF